MIRAVDDPGHFFWASGILTSFLDNAPTYLTFLSTALGRMVKSIAEESGVQVPSFFGYVFRYTLRSCCRHSPPRRGYSSHEECAMAVWQQLIVAGPADVFRAFVAGFAAGRRSAAAVVFGRDCHLAPEPLGDAIRERGVDLGLKVERRRPVRAMHVDFRVEAFSRDVVKKIRRALVTDSPSDVRVEGLQESKEEDPSARGTEVYSPAHDYVCRASGRIVGMPPSVFEVRARAVKLDFVTVGELHVQTTAR